MMKLIIINDNCIYHQVYTAEISNTGTVCSEVVGGMNIVKVLIFYLLLKNTVLILMKAVYFIDS